MAFRSATSLAIEAVDTLGPIRPVMLCNLQLAISQKVAAQHRRVLHVVHTSRLRHELRLRRLMWVQLTT